MSIAAGQGHTRRERSFTQYTDGGQVWDADGDFWEMDDDGWWWDRDDITIPPERSIQALAHEYGPLFPEPPIVF